MPRTLSYSVPERWPTEPELVVSEGEAVLRIPPPPQWLMILLTVGWGLQLVMSVLPMIIGFWLAFKFLGIRGLITILGSAGPLVWVFNGAIVLAASVIVGIEIWNTARFGNQGVELWTSAGVLHYRRLAFLRGIRTATYDADQIIELRTVAKVGRRARFNVSLHIRFRRHFPIRRRMKTSDPSFPANVESAFRAALRLSRSTTSSPNAE